jgi:hypothetical protein
MFLSSQEPWAHKTAQMWDQVYPPLLLLAYMPPKSTSLRKPADANREQTLSITVSRFTPSDHSTTAVAFLQNQAIAAKHQLVQW